MDSVEQQFKQWHNELLPEFTENFTNNVTRRLDKVENIATTVLPSHFDRFVIHPNDRCEIMDKIKPEIREKTIVQINTLRNPIKDIKQYKKTARNRLNRNKPKFLGKYVFGDIIFNKLYQFIRAQCNNYPNYDNIYPMKLFLNVLDSIFETKVSFPQSKAQPIITHNTLVNENLFKSGCIQLLKMYKVPPQQYEIEKKTEHRAEATYIRIIDAIKSINNDATLNRIAIPEFIIYTHDNVAITPPSNNGSFIVGNDDGKHNDGNDGNIPPMIYPNMPRTSSSSSNSSGSSGYDSTISGSGGSDTTTSQNEGIIVFDNSFNDILSINHSVYGDYQMSPPHIIPGNNDTPSLFNNNHQFIDFHSNYSNGIYDMESVNNIPSFDINSNFENNNNLVLPAFNNDNVPSYNPFGNNVSHQQQDSYGVQINNNNNDPFMNDQQSQSVIVSPPNTINNGPMIPSTNYGSNHGATYTVSEARYLPFQTQQTYTNNSHQYATHNGQYNQQYNINNTNNMNNMYNNNAYQASMGVNNYQYNHQNQNQYQYQQQNEFSNQYVNQNQIYH